MIKLRVNNPWLYVCCDVFYGTLLTPKRAVSDLSDMETFNQISSGRQILDYSNLWEILF